MNEGTDTVWQNYGCCADRVMGLIPNETLQAEHMTEFPKYINYKTSNHWWWATTFTSVKVIFFFAPNKYLTLEVQKL